jgi:subtilase family serine protease
MILLLAMAPISVLAQDASSAGRQGGITFARVCSEVPAFGMAECLSLVRTDSGASIAAGVPSGYSPSDLKDAYNLPTSGGAPGTGPLVAIVDAYDDPSAEADLNIYRAQFGLGTCTSTSNGGNGCFKKVNQNGVEGNYPRASRSWSQEISLDVDMVSAICPACKILLVEANNNSLMNLGASVNTAANQGAAAISNSYGGFEFSSVGSLESQFYHHPGIAITVSSGDRGYGVEFPASSQYVTAVGGTTLNPAQNSRGWTETVWSGAGSGCSRFIPKPGWQHDNGCSMRTVADVAAVADPATGVAVYDSFHGFFQSDWMVFGGTSVAAPIIASVYALAGNATSVNYGSYPYSHTGSLFDITSGSNGSCGVAVHYLCTAGGGYDGPTGNGTPNGTGGF